MSESDVDFNITVSREQFNNYNIDVTRCLS